MLKVKLMSKFFNNPMLISCATGLNMVAIAMIQAHVFDDSAKLAYSTSSPFICNLIVFGIDWWLAKKKVKSAEQLRIEAKLNDKIAIAKKNLKDAKQYGLDISDFKSELTKLMKARANVPALIAKRKANNTVGQQ